MGIDRQFLTWPRRTAASDQANRTVADAAFALAAQRIGALFALVRRDPLIELVEGGVAMTAEISPGLIDAIFQKTSPLHDGAVLIQNGRIARANAVLPLTQRPDVPPRFGTRHRAAMGLAERTDAFVIAVSEERGEVTVMRGRTYLRVDSAGELVLLLNNAFVHTPRPPLKRISHGIVAHWRFKLAAVALAAMMWGVATVESGSAVRTISVPVEFRNVPRGLDIATQSATELEVQLRGRTWMLDTMNLPRLVAQFDLGNAKEGVRSCPCGTRNSPASAGSRHHARQSRCDQSPPGPAASAARARVITASRENGFKRPRAIRINCSACFRASAVSFWPDSIRPISRVRAV